MQALFSLLSPDVKDSSYNHNPIFWVVEPPHRVTQSPHPLSQFTPYWDFSHVITVFQYKWAKALLLCLVSLESLKNKPAHIRWTLHVLSLRISTIWNSFLRAQESFPKDRPPTRLLKHACLFLSPPQKLPFEHYESDIHFLIIVWSHGWSEECPCQSLLPFNSAGIGDSPFQCRVDPQPCWHLGEQSSSAANLSIIPVCSVLVSFAVLVHMNCAPCEGI